MTINELISKGESSVRNSNELMSFYIKFFKEKLGYEPNCAGCTFHTDWAILQQAVLSNNKNLTITKMANHTHKLIDEQEIYSYLRELGNENTRVYVTGYNFTDELALEYLTNGTEEEIEFRKKQFIKLPLSQDEQDALLEAEIKAEEKAKKQSKNTK